MQAMARVHRINQINPVHIYRFVCDGTVEDRMQLRAANKLYLVSEHDILNFFLMLCGCVKVFEVSLLYLLQGWKKTLMHCLADKRVSA